MSQDEQHKECREELAQWEARTKALEKEVRELRELINRNSRNSNKPPSSDGPGARGGGEKTASGKKQGGQKGHPGHKRILLNEADVDEVVELYPIQCENCWKPLPKVRDEEAQRHQVTEIPVMEPTVTEYRFNQVRCQCGHTNCADFDLAPKSAFGPNLTALVGLLVGDYNLSRRQTERLLSDVLRVDISLGAVSDIERRISQALEPTYNEILQKVVAGQVNYADATTWLLKGKHQSLWTLASEEASYYAVYANGSREQTKQLLGQVTATLVSDRATVFGSFPMERRQICWSHLLRKFVAFSEKEAPCKKHGEALLDYAALIFEYWHALKDGKTTREEFQLRMRPLREKTEACLRRVAKKNFKEMSGSCEDILAHQKALWTFVDVEGVPPTNNHAERELRQFVIWRKRCFGAQSDRGNNFAARMMSVVRTARKQGRNVYRFLIRCVEAYLGEACPPELFSAATAGNTS